MLLHSIDFAIFLPIVFLSYWFVFPKREQQDLLLLIASYVFYGWWDVRFLVLILLSTLVDYAVGLWLDRTERVGLRRLFLGFSLAFNLGLLAFFKYYNFLADQFAAAFTLLGRPVEPTHLAIILPVGISFYTFQTLSYSIDVYWRRMKPTRHFIEFAAFVSFFPQLVAGPIERASNLLPQFAIPRQFQERAAGQGLRLILWGLFKKLVIADNCAFYVNRIFPNYTNHDPITLILAAVLFAFQIYGDFSGYSDIAVGTANLFGFRLMRNFHYPYFAASPADFWRRWHISLSTWFKDYVYIPLGGSRRGKARQILNTLILFAVSGLWHGANLRFLAWGLYHALLMIPAMVRRGPAAISRRPLVSVFRRITGQLLRFLLVTIGWVLFRSATIRDALRYLSRILTTPWTMPLIPERMLTTLVLIAGFLLIEGALLHRKERPWLPRWQGLRWSGYLAFILVIYLFSGEAQAFIYFQF